MSGRRAGEMGADHQDRPPAGLAGGEGRQGPLVGREGRAARAAIRLDGPSPYGAPTSRKTAGFADLDRIFTACQWSGFDVRCPGGRDLAKRTSNPKRHWNQYFASGPLIPTFAKVSAATGRECWNRTTGLAFVEFLAKSLSLAPADL